MDNAHIHNIHEAGLWQFESLWLGTQSTVKKKNKKKKQKILLKKEK